jgi:hypothetical protein
MHFSSGNKLFAHLAKHKSHQCEYHYVSYKCRSCDYIPDDGVGVAHYTDIRRI